MEAQNSLKRMSDGGCVTLFKAQQSHAVRFSFMPMVMKSPGLKPIDAQNARAPRLVQMFPKANPVPSRFLVLAKLSDMDGGNEFTHTNHAWGYRKL